MQRLLQFRSSLKFKVTSLITVLLLAATATVGMVALAISEAQLRSELAAQELALVRSMAAQIDDDLQNKQNLLASLAEEVRARALAPPQLQSLLEAHGLLRDEFFNVTAFDARGQLIADLRNRRLAPLNIATRAYFQDTVRSADAVLSAPFRSQLSGRPIVALTQPLTDARGRLQAMLVAGIDLQRPSFAAALAASHAPGRGYAFIVDDAGWVVHHPQASRLLQRDALAPPLAAALRASPQGARDDLRDGAEAVLLTHVHLQHAPWTVATSYPIRSAFAPLQTVRWRLLVALSGCALLTAALAWALSSWLLRPLHRLGRKVQQFDLGLVDAHVFASQRHDEVGVLSRAIHSLESHREQAALALALQANTDPLTALHNRRSFEQLLPQALSRASRSGHAIALAFLDVDKFKTINDTYGHATGDAVLVEFAQRLRAAVRNTDTPARLAGDEFVVVFEQLASAAEAAPLGDKLLAALAPPFRLGALELAVSASIGMAVSSGADSAEQLLKAADQALYQVKQAGRCGVAVRLLASGDCAAAA